MNIDSIKYLVMGGSHLYGLNVENSDVQLTGFYYQSKKERDSLFFRKDIVYNDPKVLECWRCLHDRSDVRFGCTLYSLSKFFKLASELSPKILSILFVDSRSIISCTQPVLDLLIKNRNLFLSKRISSTFLGYVSFKMRKIKMCRDWISQPPDHSPTREEFGLPELDPNTEMMVDLILNKSYECWNFDSMEIDHDSKILLKQRLVEMLNSFVTPTSFGEVKDRIQQQNLEYFIAYMKPTSELITLLRNENEYRNAVYNWEGYETWKRTNEGKSMEAFQQVGYDSKSAMDMVKTLRMTLEIISTRKFNVTRTEDGEELLQIRNGSWTLDQLTTYKADMESRIQKECETSSLPDSVNLDKINDFYLNLLERLDHDYDVS